MSSLSWAPLQLYIVLINQVSYPLYIVNESVMFFRLDSCGASFTTNILLKVVASERVYFRFGLEASCVYFKFRNLSCSLSLFLISILDKVALSFPFYPISL